MTTKKRENSIGTYHYGRARRIVETELNSNSTFTSCVPLQVKQGQIIYVDGQPMMVQSGAVSVQPIPMQNVPSASIGTRAYPQVNANAYAYA